MIDILARSGVGVLPTDTIYGIVGSALSQAVVQRIAKLKGRSKAKPFIILIGDIYQLKLFGIETNKQTLADYWPGPNSLVLPCANKSFRYLHQGTDSLAFRLPGKEQLWQLLEKTGPLVAPSANPESSPPAKNLEEAKGYFGSRVDFYVDGGTLNNRPSRLISLLGKKPKLLRG